MHHAYMRADNLNNVTPRRLMIYARWSDEGGAASAPMLGKMITTDEALLAGVFTLTLGVTPASVAALYVLYKSLVPDLTINESANSAFRRSSARLIQTMFHELGHAAHFAKTGRNNWLTYIWQIVNNAINGEPCGSIYGCGTEQNAGIVQVGEAWAEFIGTEHARPYHPNGSKCSEFFFQTTGNCTVRFDTALERENWFEVNFIPSGFFHDLRDDFNNNETWDLVQGVTIRQMYNALTPQANNMCNYIDVLLSQNQGLNINNLWLLLENNADTQNFCNI